MTCERAILSSFDDPETIWCSVFSKLVCAVILLLFFFFFYFHVRIVHTFLLYFESNKHFYVIFSIIPEVFLLDTALQHSKILVAEAAELERLLQCLAHTMNHKGLTSWDHRKTFDKQAPECFCSQQAILWFAVRGQHASSQITPHSSQHSLCSFLSVGAVASRDSKRSVSK